MAVRALDHRVTSPMRPLKPEPTAMTLVLASTSWGSSLPPFWNVIVVLYGVLTLRTPPTVEAVPMLCATPLSPICMFTLS